MTFLYIVDQPRTRRLMPRYASELGVEMPAGTSLMLNRQYVVRELAMGGKILGVISIPSDSARIVEHHNRMVFDAFQWEEQEWGV